MLLNLLQHKKGEFVRKLLVIYILMFTNVILFSQNAYYNLSQEDTNSILGQYIRSDYVEWSTSEESSFSWGKQNALGNHSGMMRIDYDKTSNVHYGFDENMLWLFASGLIYLITKIEKHSANKFILTIATLQKRQDIMILYKSPHDRYYFRDEGHIVITYLDNINIIFENNTKEEWLNSDFKVQWIKTAGPDFPFIPHDDVFKITENEVFDFLENSVISKDDEIIITENEINEKTESRILWLLFMLIPLFAVTVILNLRKKTGGNNGRS